MTFLSSVGNAAGGPLGEVIEVADQFVQQAVPGLSLLNQFVNVQSGGSDGVSRQLHNNAVAQQQDDIRRSERRGGRGGQGGGGCQPQGCTGGAGGAGGGGGTLELLAEVLGNMQEARAQKLIDAGKRMASASDDELLKLSTEVQTQKLLTDVSMEASKNVINGYGQNMAKPLQQA